MPARRRTACTSSAEGRDMLCLFGHCRKERNQPGVPLIRECSDERHVFDRVLQVSTRVLWNRLLFKRWAIFDAMDRVLGGRKAFERSCIHGVGQARHHIKSCRHLFHASLLPSMLILAVPNGLVRVERGLGVQREVLCQPSLFKRWLIVESVHDSHKSFQCRTICFLGVSLADKDPAWERTPKAGPCSAGWEQAQPWSQNMAAPGVCQV